MYNIENKSKIYYFYNKNTNKVSKIGDENELITYVVSHFSKNPFFTNTTIIDYNDVDFSGSDIYYYYDFRSKDCGYFNRPIVFYDGYGKIVDIRIFQKQFNHILQKKKEILDKRQEIAKEYGSWYSYERKKRKEKKYEYGDLLVQYYHYWPNTSYHYRIDPVPCTGKRKGGPYQHKPYGSIIRMINHPDFKKYGRKSHYQSLITDVSWYEYGHRHNDKSWKNNKKIKKQWQKNLK